MLEQGCQVQCVGKQLPSLNEVSGEIGVVDLCIRADRGLELLQNCEKPFKSVVIQPGASSKEPVQYLQNHQIPYIDGCLLLGLKLYRP